MDGFKNTTRTQYSMGGYAKGGSLKGAAKVGKVMGEFKAGTLHSGSKKGPAVTNPKQAIAIGLSEAHKAAVGHKKGGSAKGPSVERSKSVSTSSKVTPTMNAQEVRRMEKYKAAMASRPNRQPVIADGKRLAQVQTAAAAMKGALEKAISTRAAQQNAAQPAPPMTPPPAMKKGGEVMKLASGGLSEFGAAFRAARKEQGDGGTFTFKGKKYTTDVASSKPAAKAASVATYAAHAPSSRTLAEYTSSPPTPAVAPPTLRDKAVTAQTQAKVKQDALDNGGYDAAAKRRGQAVADFINPSKERTAKAMADAKASLQNNMGNEINDVGLAKGGKVRLKRDMGGMASSIRPAKDYHQSDADFVASRGEQLNALVGRKMAKGGEGSKADLKQDKAMIKAAVHKHERHDHPGKPLTKLRKGGTAC